MIALGKLEQLEKVVAAVSPDAGETEVDAIGVRADAGEAVARPSGDRVRARMILGLTIPYG